MISTLSMWTLLTYSRVLHQLCLTFLEDFIVCLILYLKLDSCDIVFPIYTAYGATNLSHFLSSCQLYTNMQYPSIKMTMLRSKMCSLPLCSPINLHGNFTCYLCRKWNLKQSFWHPMLKFLQILISSFCIFRHNVHSQKCVSECFSTHFILCYRKWKQTMNN